MVQAVQVAGAQGVLQAIAAQEVGDRAEGIAGNQNAVTVPVGNAREIAHCSHPSCSMVFSWARALTLASISELGREGLASQIP
ncbi:hypothetical protein D3C84_1121270 [compost metagenome]